jgi:AcrR family transcriptional regulator
VRREKLHTEIRRDQIAEAALAVMADRGVRGMSVAAVAHRVGLSPSALYRHYRGKDEMLDAVLERVRERLHGAIAQCRAEAPDPLEALHRLLHRHMTLLRQNQGLPRVLLSDHFHSGHLERRQRLMQVFSGYLEGVADMIRLGQSQGQIRDDVNASSLAILFLGLIQPASVLWTLSDGRFDITRQARSAWPVFEQALRAPGVPRARRPTPAGPSPRPSRSRRTSS